MVHPSTAAPQGSPPKKQFARSYAVPRDKPGSNIKRPHAASQAYQPGQICAAYNWPTGIAVTPLAVAILELGGAFYPNDVSVWATKAGLPPPVVVVHNLTGSDNSPSDADGEVALDWQLAAQAHSSITSQPLTVHIINLPNSGAAFATGVQYASTLPNIGAGSISWGSDEPSWSAAERAAYDAACQACPYPWSAAAGDNGSNDGSNQPTTDFPAASPYNLGCGGTSRVPSGGTESVWNNGDGEGTGGGFSKVYPRPSWQPANAQGTGRMVPDWAANADPNTGYEVLVNGVWQVYGGTSAVAPLMGGFMIAVNGARLKAGLPMIGQANAALWALQSCFMDISSGTNGSYRAGVGPDPCSGLGRALPALFAALTGSQAPPPPPPPPPPAPTLGRLFGLSFPRPVRQGAPVSFLAPVAIPAGDYDVDPSTTPFVQRDDPIVTDEG